MSLWLSNLFLICLQTVWQFQDRNSFEKVPFDSDSNMTVLSLKGSSQPNIKSSNMNFCAAFLLIHGLQPKLCVCWGGGGRGGTLPKGVQQTSAVLCKPRGSLKNEVWNFEFLTKNLPFLLKIPFSPKLGVVYPLWSFRGRGYYLYSNLHTPCLYLLQISSPVFFLVKTIKQSFVSTVLLLHAHKCENEREIAKKIWK